jgi:hypothetical protein
MAVLGSTYLNLIDMMKQSDNGLYEVVEVLHKLNPFMKDANVLTCNMGTKHKSVIRTGLPAVSWGMLYAGIAQSKSTTTEVEDTTGFVEGLSSVDERLLNLYGDKASAVRMSEGMAFLESISQEVESQIFYSNVNINGKQFHGLAPRYNTLANPCVVGGGGVGSDNTSIWMVTHGDGQVSVLTPEGVPAGVTQEDKGEQRVLDAAGNPYYVREEKFEQHVGIAVKDWRYTGRIANIDVSEALAGNVDVYRLLTALFYRLQGRRHYKFDGDGKPMQGRTVIYMNRVMLEVLDNLASARSGGSALNAALRLSRMEIQGEEVLTWRGVPIRETDAILNTEAAIA